MTGGVTTQEKIPRNSRDSGLRSSADRGEDPGDEVADCPS